MFDTLHEECGVFGVVEPSKTKVALTTYYGLQALQHRGQESCGIAVSCDGHVTTNKGLGLVAEVFNTEEIQKLGEGQMAVGHVRYSTTGVARAANAQPLVVRHVHGPMTLAHNGNLTNAAQLRSRLEMGGAIFHTTSDTEVISFILTQEWIQAPDIETAMLRTMDVIKGAYSLVVMTGDKLLAVRDPNGFRPLVIGRTATGGILFASESCALETCGAQFVRDVRPGEIVVADASGELRSIDAKCGQEDSLCVFEFVYFARSDSVIENASVHQARIRAGAYLALEHPVQADVVIGVPDSGLDAALGFSRQSGIPYGVGLLKNRYIGRTFIQPTQEMRENAVRIKLNTIGETIRGKRVVLIDDSIVRGTTSARIVNLVREAGAKEIHMRISSPPFTHPCYFGTDIDSSDSLIAAHQSVEEIAKTIGVDTLGYLSVENVQKLAEGCHCHFCTGCFSGQYPIAPPAATEKNKFE